MKLGKARLICALGAGLLLAWPIGGRAACGEVGTTLQILGSAGPFGAGRASAGYIVWVDGESRVMVDAGGGTFARFHESGATFAELQLLALSHFHPDHSSEMPALLWPRGGDLRVAGPSGSDGFPSLNEFLTGLFGSQGVFRILNSRVTLDPVQVDVSAKEPSEVFRSDGIVVTALAVPHGAVPALGYRVESNGTSIVFSSDQNGTDPTFVDLAREADILVVHFAGSEDATGQRGSLHAKPSVWGRIATQAKVRRLVLSHISSNQDLNANLETLKNHYSGPLTVGKDLLCVETD